MILYVVSSFCLVSISIIMLCRANDLRWRPGWNWQVRLGGFVMCGAMPLGIVAMEWTTRTYPTPYEVFFRVGLLAVFATTPHLPPLWRWISGQEKARDTN